MNISIILVLILQSVKILKKLILSKKEKNFARMMQYRNSLNRHSSYPIENHTTIRTETFGLKISGKGDAKICLKNSVGQKLKIYVSDTKITVDRTMAGYKEFSEHFMTEKYSISTAARKKDGAWNLELVFDVSILELFAEDGVDAISTVVYPETPYDRISWKGDLSVELYEIDA